MQGAMAPNSINPPRPLASKRVDLISNKLIKIKEKKPPLYPLQGPRVCVLFVGFSPSPVSGLVAGQAEVILEIRALRPKFDAPIFRDPIPPAFPGGDGDGRGDGRGSGLLGVALG